METIGQRITRLRIAMGWSRPELGRQMQLKTGRSKPFSGEVIRLYEEDINRPGKDARQALSRVFERSEAYIEFGATTSAQVVAEAKVAQYDARIRSGSMTGAGDAEKLLALITTFLNTDAEGRAELAKAAASVSQAHGSAANQARRAKRR
jgi:transcriptional regulator with XRE-family HTH domain